MIGQSVVGAASVLRADECDAACRWLLRVVTFGLNRNRLRIGAELGEAFARRLVAAPIRFYIEAGALTHPPRGRPLNPEHIVGIVEAAWADHKAVYAIAHLASDARRVRWWLVALERAGRLTMVGISWWAAVPRISSPEAGGIDGERATEIQEIYAVDFVTGWPAGEGCCVLQSLPLEVCPAPPRARMFSISANHEKEER